MRKFFKKASPSVPLYVEGRPVRFERVTNDVGIYATEDAGLQEQFARAMREERGGVFEISEEEHKRLAEKKTMNLPTHLRDEFGKGSNRSLQTNLTENHLVSHADGTNPEEHVAPKAELPPQSGFKPGAVKR